MIPTGARVWIALGHTDMRRGMSGREVCNEGPTLISEKLPDYNPLG